MNDIINRMGPAQKVAWPKSCIFCGQSGMSREHIFPAWMQEYFSTADVWANNFSVTVDSPMGKPETRKTAKGALHKFGNPLGQRLKVVCQKCNSGWMSIQQQRIKPLLVPLLKGEWHTLNHAEKRKLATWITMFFCVADFSDPTSVAIPQSQRTGFYTNPEPLSDWLIWIGFYAGKRLSTSFFSTSLETLPETEEPKDRKLKAADAHIGAVVIGKLFVHVVSTSRSDLLSFINAHYAPNVLLTQIWPSPDSIVNDRPKTFSDGGFLSMTQYPSALLGGFLERAGHRPPVA